MLAPSSRTSVSSPPRIQVPEAGTPRPPHSRRRIVLPPVALVLLASLAVKLALWAWFVASANPAALLQDDAASYHDSARALLETGTFSVSPHPPLFPQVYRTPGYPGFLAAVYALAGERPAAAVLVQLLLSVATIALAYRLARGLWGARVALLAAALLALDVSSLLFSLLPLTETLFTFLLVAALGCGVAVLTRRERRRWALGLGLLLAACTLVRPAAYYLAVPVAVGLLVHGWRGGWGARATAWTLALVLLPYCAVVGGWRYRNLRVSGSSAFTQVDGTVLLLFRGSAIVARRDGIGMAEARARVERAYDVRPDDPRTTRDNERWRRAGIALIRQNPGIYARVVAEGVLRTLLVPGGVTLGRPEPQTPEPGWRDEARDRGLAAALRARLARRGALYAATFALDALLVVATLAAAAYGVGRLAARRRISVVDVFLLGVVLYLLLVHAGPTSGVRTRVPIAPVLALYAARGVAELRARRPALP